MSTTAKHNNKEFSMAYRAHDEDKRHLKEVLWRSNDVGVFDLSGFKEVIEERELYNLGYKRGLDVGNEIAEARVDALNRQIEEMGDLPWWGKVLACAMLFFVVYGVTALCIRLF